MARFKYLTAKISGIGDTMTIIKINSGMVPYVRIYGGVMISLPHIFL